jgi:hypothetical protein
MPTYKVSKTSSTSRRKGLVSRVSALGKAAVMPCSPCTSLGARCVFSSLSLKCSECIRRGVACDGNAFAKGFDKIESEKKKLELARQSALEQAALKSAEALSLNRRIKSLWNAQEQMISRETRALEELEREE